MTVLSDRTGPTVNSRKRRLSSNWSLRRSSADASAKALAASESTSRAHRQAGQMIGQLHHRRDSRVEAQAIEIVADALDRLVQLAQGIAIRLHVAHAVQQLRLLGPLIDEQPPDATQEPIDALDTA